MPRQDPALAKRLEMLDAGCCVEDLEAIAHGVRTSPRFATALLRAKALSDERRLLAAAFVKRRGEACGCEIQAALGVTHATVSHHMDVLDRAGLVVPERRGKWVYYTIAPGAEAHIP